MNEDTETGNPLANAYGLLIEGKRGMPLGRCTQEAQGHSLHITAAESASLDEGETLHEFGVGFVELSREFARS
jgi:hypothetical protein